MKCPVCDQENSTMLCTRCGFDASMDYEKYPTFALIGDDIPTKKIRSQEAKKTSRVENDHYLRELIHKCADALVKIDAQQGEIRSLQLQLQNVQVEHRKAQQELRKAQQENMQLQLANSKLIAEIESYEDKSVARSLEMSKLKDELKDTKKYYSGAKEAIQQLRIQENDYKKEISEKSEEINHLQKLLEEEQNKSLLARIFNR